MSDKDLTISGLQHKVDEWIRLYGCRYFDVMTNMALLTEEVGEVARVVARTYGEQSSKAGESQKMLADELADLLWVATCIANQCGIDLTEAIRQNFEKKTKRDNTRHLDNPKLQRNE